MYSRTAQTVEIKFRERGCAKFIKAKITLHNSWIEIQGTRVTRDYKPKVWSTEKNERGSISSETENNIYPESSIEYVSIDNKKIDMRHYRKE